jgi:hypothetical protein
MSKKPVSIKPRRKARKKQLEEEPEGEIIYNVIDPDQDAAFKARWDEFWNLLMQSAINYQQTQPRAA